MAITLVIFTDLAERALGLLVQCSQPQRTDMAGPMVALGHRIILDRLRADPAHLLARIRERDGAQLAGNTRRHISFVRRLFYSRSTTVGTALCLVRFGGATRSTWARSAIRSSIAAAPRSVRVSPLPWSGRAVLVLGCDFCRHVLWKDVESRWYLRYVYEFVRVQCKIFILSHPESRVSSESPDFGAASTAGS